MDGQPKKPAEGKGGNTGNPLDRVLEQYYENPTREIFMQVCEQLFIMYFCNMTATCPTEFGPGGLTHKFFPTPDYGMAFIVYTSPEKNPEMKEPETYAFIPWRNILQRAADDPESSGIVINPYNGHGTYVWLSPVFIRMIVKRAQEALNNALRDKTNPGGNN